jgi:tetratricopeptide (TPR) repeat protein
MREVDLLHRHALLELDAGRVRHAVRWSMRGLRALDGAAGDGVVARRAQLTATLATIRWRAGRLQDAIALCQEAIVLAEAAGEETAVARACYVLDTARTYAGQTVTGEYFRRALEIYERLGDLDRQAAVLNNMGVSAYWAGRWTAAVDLYRRGAAASEAAGDAGNAAFGEGNVGELLSDQGRTDEADELLRRALRVFRGTGYEWNAAYTTALLGRSATRAGRPQQARELLDEAVAGFIALGVAGDAAWADTLRAEADVHDCDAAGALERVDRLLLDHAGTGRLAPLLHRVRGLALAQLGDGPAAEGALGASLAEARLQDEPAEVAASLHALEALADRFGFPVNPDRAAERDGILERLGVVRLPRAPVAPAAAAADATDAA